LHSQREIIVLIDHIIGRRPIKARPPGSRVVFAGRFEERLAAAHAQIPAILVVLVILSRESALGALLPRYAELFLCQALSPLSV
jgi:hypothetical protein